MICKGLFQAEERTEVFALFDAEAARATCSMPKLQNAGVSALKIVGRELNPQQMKEIVAVL
jgi:collagenase-like PrtC family protease